MKKILVRILIVIAVLVVVFVIVVATRPADFKVARSAVIVAPSEAVFPHVNELKKWDAWSPWAKIDPNCKITLEGPEAGVGSSMSWTGNMQVGEGKMTITESKANELVHFQLVFVKPMAGTSDAEFTFTPEGNPKGSTTTVVWSMSGKNNFVAKAISLFMDCDKMVGGQFEQGLASLKKVVEATPATAAPATEAPAK